MKEGETSRGNHQPPISRHVVNPRFSGSSSLVLSGLVPADGISSFFLDDVIMPLGYVPLDYGAVHPLIAVVPCIIMH